MNKPTPKNNRGKKKVIPKEIKKVHAVVYDAVFNQQVDVLLNYTAEEYARWLTKEKIKDVQQKSLDDFAAWTSDYEAEDGKTKAIIFIPKFQWAILHQGTLIHEITHVIIKIWARNNIPFTPDNQEFLAHSIGRMYENIAHKLLKYKP